MMSRERKITLAVLLLKCIAAVTQDDVVFRTSENIRTCEALTRVPLTPVPQKG